MTNLYIETLAHNGNPFVFSDKNEIEAQRRRKGPGPTGRAEKPVFRPPSGSGGIPSGGGSGQYSSGSSGGSWLPTSGGTGTGRPRIPLWLIILGIIALLMFGGKGLLGNLLGGSTNTGYYTEPPSSYEVATTAPQNLSAPVTGFTPPAGSKDGSWTVMVYQDADDQVLEQDILTDFNEMELVGSSDQVHIVAQLDRFRGAYSGDGNWTSARRYYVTRDSDLANISSQLVADLGEVNMADPATLVDFVTWSMSTFPADHYALILSDHGMGWPGGWIDPAPAVAASSSAPLAQKIGNALYLDKLDDALAVIRQQTGIDKLDILGMDACLMGQLEVLSALEPHARYAILSEETEPALGWAYSSFLQALTANPGMSPEDLSKLVVQSYISEDQRIVDEQARSELLYQMGRGYASAAQLVNVLGKDSTLSAIDLSRIPTLINRLNDLSYVMQGADQSDVATARNYALSFSSIFGKSVPPSFIDLGNFLQILYQQSNNSDVRSLAEQVYVDIQNAVIAEKHGTGKNGATGISIYFPNSQLYANAYSGPQSYTVIANRFSENSLWDDFLAFHYRNRSFKAETREVVVPSSGLPSRAPGAGQINVGALQLSSRTAAPNQPVTMRSAISGSNIGNIYLFVGYYDASSSYIFVADTDFLESPDTQEAEGVYYPRWGDGSDFTVKFDWDPVLFTISDGNVTDVALFTPQSYGASAEEAIYTVEGTYTYAESGSTLSARLYFRNGELVSVYGITGDGDTGAPREIIPNIGDTFTVQQKWLQLDSNGQVTGQVTQDSDTVLTFSSQAFTWGQTYAPEGDYIIGFVVTDLDGNSQEVYDQVTVQ